MNSYAESDYATCQDGRLSVTGRADLVGEGVISWFSRRKGMAAVGRTETEYMALRDVVQEVVSYTKCKSPLC